MTQTSLSIPAGTCLITRLKAELCRKDIDRSQVHVVLPTQRLHVFLCRELAAAAGGACILPRLWTWDQFLREECRDHVTTELVMVSSQCELIMEDVLDQLTATATREHRPINTHRRHAHELLYLASELDKSGLHQVARQKLLDWLERDWRRDDAVRQDILRRIDDIFAAIQGFQSKMSAAGWISESAARAEALQRRLGDDARVPMPAASRIIIAGLTSLPELESQFLARLATDQRVEVWLDEPPPDVDHAPLAGLRQKLGMLANHPADPAVWASGVRRIVAAGDVTSEITASLLWAQDLVRQGLSPHEIALVVPDEATYAPAYQALAQRIQVSVNMPLAEPWEATLPARWLHLVTEVPKGFKTHVIGQYLLHPMTRALFEPSRQDGGLDTTKLQRVLKDFPESESFGPGSLEPLREFLTSRFTPEDAAYMVKAIEYCTQSPVAKAQATETELIQEFVSTLITDLSKLRQTFKSTGAREESAWKHCETAALQVAALATLSHKKNSSDAAWRQFLSRCYRCAAGASVRATGEPMDGLQIIGLTEARYVPFAAVRIVGCVEGSFPHALPRDSLIDHAMRQAMGLPGWHELEALEDTTFHLLTARLSWVELSYAKTSHDQRLIRSRWIERLAVTMTVEEFSSDAPALEGDLGPTTQKPLPEPRSGLEGQTPDGVLLTAKASASRLRDLIWCPYRYLMTARKIQAVELPEDRTQLKTGTILHKILERFFTTDIDDRLDEPLRFQYCPPDASKFADWAHQRLDAIALVTTPKNLARHPQFQHMAGRGWRQVAQRWAALYAAGFSPEHVTTEMQIGRSQPRTIKLGDRKIAVDGSIDAVFRRDGATILVDYKTGKTPSMKAVGDGLEPQLPLYAWALSEREPLTATAVSYLNLSEGQQSIAAVTAELKPQITAAGLISSAAKPADLEAAFASVKTRWTARLGEIEQSARFMADPSDCQFCEFTNICRKNDPRERDRIRAQAQVKAP